MTHDLILPELGENVTSGTVVAVLVKVDDVVELEQPVIEIETDKAVAEVPADVAGRVTAIHVQEGQEIEVNLRTQTITLPSGVKRPCSFSDVQMDIYKRGGLLNR